MLWLRNVGPAVCLLLSALAPAASAATQSLPKPTAQQLSWQHMQFGVMVHFGLPTFANTQGDNGGLSPLLFNPDHLDPAQWVAAAKAAGAAYLILVARHGDGFALWPTTTTPYSVANSPWDRGRGNLVRLTAAACRKYGLKFGIYLAPSDKHYFRKHPSADTADYEHIYLTQLDELASDYGPLAEWWFDGSGPKGFDFGRAVNELRTYQPNTAIFAAINVTKYATVRWGGNETGHLNVENNWNVVTSYGRPRWLPTEVDTPILTHDQWYWNRNSKVRSVKQLVTVWNHSVGRGAQLVLGISPDARGILPHAEVAVLKRFGAAVKADYGESHNLALHRAAAPKNATAADVRNVSLATDGDPNTWWTSPFSGSGSLVVHFPVATTLNTCMIKERIADGQRVRRYSVQAMVHGDWETLVTHGAIGVTRIDHFKAVTTQSVRLNILNAVGHPQINEFELFMIPALGAQVH